MQMAVEQPAAARRADEDVQAVTRWSAQLVPLALHKHRCRSSSTGPAKKVVGVVDQDLVDDLTPAPQESRCELELGEGWSGPSAEDDAYVQDPERDHHVDVGQGRHETPHQIPHRSDEVRVPDAWYGWGTDQTPGVVE